MKKIGRMVAVTGTYIDRQTNEEKRRYHNCGPVFQRDDGSLCLKFESVPVNWDGWLNVYPDDERKQPAKQPVQPAQQSLVAPDLATEDIPF